MDYKVMEWMSAFIYIHDVLLHFMNLKWTVWPFEKEIGFLPGGEAGERTGCRWDDDASYAELGQAGPLHLPFYRLMIYWDSCSTIAHTNK